MVKRKELFCISCARTQREKERKASPFVQTRSRKECLSLEDKRRSENSVCLIDWAGTENEGQRRSGYLAYEYPGYFMLEIHKEVLSLFTRNCTLALKLNSGPVIFPVQFKRSECYNWLAHGLYLLHYYVKKCLGSWRQSGSILFSFRSKGDTFLAWHNFIYFSFNEKLF